MIKYDSQNEKSQENRKLFAQNQTDKSESLNLNFY